MSPTGLTDGPHDVHRIALQWLPPQRGRERRRGFNRNFDTGIETVRIALHRAGFVCKRPRWVLTRKAQAQPEWAKND